MPVARSTTADEMEKLSLDDDSWRTSRSAVATTLRRGVSMLHCFGRGLIMFWLRQGAGVGGSGVGAGLGTTVSFTVELKINSYDATYIYNCTDRVGQKSKPSMFCHNYI